MPALALQRNAEEETAEQLRATQGYSCHYGTHVSLSGLRTLVLYFLLLKDTLFVEDILFMITH